MIGVVSEVVEPNINDGGVLPGNFLNARIGQSFTSLNQVAGGAINNMLSGIGNMIQSYILLENSSGQSLRKLTAQVLASIASQAAVLAIFETAKGLASLFFAPEEAAAHFGAAVLFASIAGITAALARGIAGDSFKQTGSKQATAQSVNGISGGSSGGQNSSNSSGGSRNGGAYYSSFGETANVREEDRLRTINSQSDYQRSVQHDTLTLRVSADLIERHLIQKLRDRGDVRKLIWDIAND